MDCRTALEILEVARPDSDDVKQTELAWAQAHLDSCPRCEEAFHNRQALDRRIGRLMRDVSLPWNLKHKLLQDSISQRRGVPGGTCCDRDHS